jgi:tRNA threonylcarbamoyladenosine biosynthesis protein TsaB
MNILAIETSLAQASLCLYTEGKLAYSAEWTAERNHDAHLFPALELALSSLGQSSLDYILVGAGPGSYGGVRVALAAAIGISTVRGGKLVSLCSWQGLAPQDCAIISDARRGGWTVYRPGQEICVMPPAQLLQAVEDGLLVYTIESEECLQKAGLTAVRYNLLPTAGGLVDAWLKLPQEEREQLEQKPAEPIYVRPPHITEAKRKPWEV